MQDNLIGAIVLALFVIGGIGLTILILRNRPGRELGGARTRTREAEPGAFSFQAPGGRLRLWVTFNMDGCFEAEQLTVRVDHEVLADGKLLDSGTATTLEPRGRRIIDARVFASR